MAAERQACLAAGMDEHLVKPIDEDALAAVIAATPARHQPMRSVMAPHLDAAVFVRLRAGAAINSSPSWCRLSPRTRRAGSTSCAPRRLRPTPGAS